MKLTESIWHQYHTKLAAFISSKVAEDLVDDLLQDVFIKIHAGIGSVKENSRLESWIFQITRNTIIDHYRSKQTVEELPEWLEKTQPDEDETIRRELSSCLEPMVKGLPEKYRNAIQLSEIESKTQQEVAELEDLSLSGAKSRVQRGRVLLKAMLYECCQFEINNNNQITSYEKKQQDCKYC